VSAGEPVRVAIVRLTHDHVYGLLGRPRDLGDVQIVGVFEPNRELAERRAREHNLDTGICYDDLPRMLDETRPEAACLFGSILEHRDDALACIERGVHVMVEKPLAVSLADARVMAEAAQRADVTLLTNYETTWYASIHEALRRAKEPDFGAIRRVVVRAGHGGPVEIGCRPEFLAWLLAPEQNGGGAITDFGCYGVNLATWFADGERPTSVMATVATRKPHRYPKVDDDATITLDYPDRVAVIQASWNWPHNVKELSVYGERGELITLGADRLRRHAVGDAPRERAAAPLPPDERDGYAHLAAVVRGERGPNRLSSIANNLLVMEVLDAARRSAATGKRVELGRPRP
jgi:predicted dehydrogenase